MAGIESRGFIFGSIVAQNLGAGFVPIRKPGKLPWTTRRHEYVLEYGSDALEIHDDALHPDDRVLVIDDVLATGGTLAAAMHLVRGFERHARRRRRRHRAGLPRRPREARRRRDAALRAALLIFLQP